MSSPQTELPVRPSFREALRFWCLLGFISFGGPTGQIAVMHEEVVRRRRWISEERFLHALNFCMILPGPEAQQLAIYLGWMLHRTVGGIAAGVLFVLPAAVLLWALSWLYSVHGTVPWIHAAFGGLQAAVLAIVISALVRLGRKVLKKPLLWAVAASACVLLLMHVPFPWILLGAAMIALVGGRLAPGLFPEPAPKATDALLELDLADPDPPSLSRSLRVAVIGLSLWWIPVAVLAGILGGGHILVREGLFFSKAALLTFGGAYAVLPYVSQQAVQAHHWLTAPQMLDGLGLAETTPGPLIMVLQFVGFLGAWNEPHPFSPLMAATLGAAITTWTTFVPCFLWILLGAPYVERLRHWTRVRTVLSVLSSAVVGTMLAFATTLARAVLLPSGGPVNGFGLILALLAGLALVRARWSVPRLVLAAAAIGIARWGLVSLLPP